MAVPREVIRLPNLRGLNDYPDKASLGAASEAYNVEFSLGGVSPRGGATTLNTFDGPSNHQVRVRGAWCWIDHENQTRIVVAYHDKTDGKGYIALHAVHGGLIELFKLSSSFSAENNRVVSSGSGWRLKDLGFGDDVRHNNNVGADYSVYEPNKMWGGTDYQPVGIDPVQPFSYFIITTTEPHYSENNLLGLAMGSPPAGEPVQMWAIHRVPNKDGEGWHCNAVNAINREYFDDGVRDFDHPIHLDGGYFIPERGSRPLPYWGGVPNEAYLASEIDADDPGGYVAPPDISWKAAGVLGDPIPDMVKAAHVGRTAHCPGWVGPAGIIGAKSITSYNGRLVIGGLNTKAERNAIRFNNYGDLQVGPGQRRFDFDWNGRTEPRVYPHQVGTGWPLDNIVFFTNPDNSPVVAVSTFRDFLVVFKRSSIHVCRFTNIYDFSQVKVFSNVGVRHSSAHAVVSTGGTDVLFFASDRGFFAFDGQLNYLSGPIERRVQKALREAENVVVEHRPSMSQVWFHVDASEHYGGNIVQAAKGAAKQQPIVSEAASGSTIFAFHYRTGDWSILDYGYDFRALATVPAPGLGWSARDSSADILYGVYEISTGNGGYGITCFDLEKNCVDRFAGSENVRYAYVTQRIAYNRHQVRRWSHIRLSHKEESLEDKYVELFWLFDNQDRPAADDNSQGFLLPIRSGNFLHGTFGTGTFGNAKFAAPGYFSSRTAIKGEPARWFRVGIESHDTAHDQPWLVNGMEIDTRRKEGRR